MGFLKRKVVTVKHPTTKRPYTVSGFFRKTVRDAETRAKIKNRNTREEIIRESKKPK